MNFFFKFLQIMHFEIKSRLKILIIVASAWLMCDALLNEGDFFFVLLYG